MDFDIEEDAVVVFGVAPAIADDAFCQCLEYDEGFEEESWANTLTRGKLRRVRDLEGRYSRLSFLCVAQCLHLRTWFPAESFDNSN